jgi:glycosyltransferase involved in cell wall biosynthesis
VDFVIVDNGSSDDTFRLLSSLTEDLAGVKIVRLEKNQGYGGGIKFGLSFCDGEVVGWTHADLQTNPSDVLSAAPLYSNHQRFLIKGMRFGRPAGDRFFSAGMGIVSSVLFGMRLKDINAQPTLFSRTLLSAIESGPSDFGLDLHALAVSRRMGFVEKRFPVEFGDRHAGKSSWNTSLRGRLKFIIRTLSYSVQLRWKLGRYADH